MDISFKAASLPSAGILVLSAYEGGALGPLGRKLDKDLGGALGRAIEAKNFKGKAGAVMEVLAPASSGLSRIVIAGLGAPAKVTAITTEDSAANAFASLSTGAGRDATVLFERVAGVKLDANELAAHAAFGASLRSYKFDKYKTKKDPKNGKKGKKEQEGTSLTFGCGSKATAGRLWADLSAVADGVFLARDLVNEPANHLHPEEFAKRCKALSKLGVKVQVLGEKQMKDLGMGALLGVGQGSAFESQLAVMQWNGDTNSSGKPASDPIAFVGKGLCFDSGGISIKPSGGMEDMKGDMGGAAAVTGLMHTLAKRKAKANVVGVVALSENMLGTGAQRPGDVVTSMSGQTIAVLNTDAEGRLVLADALWYTQDKFKPQFMIDLATLTGAIIVGLGHEHAGLFTNSDDIAKGLSVAGNAVDEPVWRMPMNAKYNSQINSKIADMQNIGVRGAGSITAAQFLKRFTNGIPWAHLDIAGMAWRPNTKPTVHTWGTGYGVKLLDRFIADGYEKGSRKKTTRKAAKKTAKKATRKTTKHKAAKKKR